MRRVWIRELVSRELEIELKSRMLRYGGPQDRVTDHRIGKSWGNIAQVMDGSLGKIIESLQSA